ncbi:MAG: 4Fe-4S dicluster domain-containing protein [Candidatus Sulfobium sp.]|jgi:ferredoxin
MTEQKEPKVEEIKKAAEEEKKCPVQRSLFYIEGFLDGPMCGRCFPCAFGSYEARVRLKRIIQGRGGEDDIRTLRRISEEMLTSSRCKKGKDTAAFLTEWLNTDVFRRHAEGSCPDMECKSLIEYRIIPEKCTMCGLCLEACKYAAIHGEKRRPFASGYSPFEIRQKRCVKCGDCLPVCPYGAIVIVEKEVPAPVGG